MIRTSSIKKEFPERKENHANASGSKAKEHKPFKKQEKKNETVHGVHNSKPASTLENFTTSSVPEREESAKPRYCKFCEIQGIVCIVAIHLHLPKQE